MSDSSNPSPTQNSSQLSSQPRAIIHKQILDVAELSPSASMEEVAAEVSGASVSLVERVLEEYGDPGENGHDGADETSSHSTSASDPSGSTEHITEQDMKAKHDLTVDRDQLSEKQRQTLHTIFKHPEATQREIADLLDVSGATISNRVNSIEGFEWKRRQEFVTTMFEEHSTTHAEEIERRSDADQDITGQIADLANRIETLEAKVNSRSDQERVGLVAPGLIHKVAHACLTSEHITEDEELQILQAVLNQPRGTSDDQ